SPTRGPVPWPGSTPAPERSWLGPGHAIDGMNLPQGANRGIAAAVRLANSQLRAAPVLAVEERRPEDLDMARPGDEGVLGDRALADERVQRRARLRVHRP